MPGLTIWMSDSASRPNLLSRFREAQATMCHATDYAATTALAERGTCVGYVGYPEYPVAFASDELCLVGLEGRIWGAVAASELSGLRRLAREIFTGQAPAGETIRQWVSDHDGDYVVVLAARNGERLFIFSDTLGRLPVYFHHDPAGLVAARECKFILGARNQAAFDRIALAQHLWLGYPLGRRTLFEGVSRLPAAGLIEATKTNGTVTVTVHELSAWNLEQKDQRVSRATAAGDLADAFRATIRKMCVSLGDAPIVLSLSGGHDSRSIAAGLKGSGLPFRAVTFWFGTGSGDRFADDARIAREVARRLELDWDLVPLPAVEFDDERRLVWLKDGLNFTGVAYMLPFLDRLVARSGHRTAFVTGALGEIMTDRRPTRRVGDTRDLQKAVIHEHAIMPPATAEAIAEVQPGTLQAELERCLSEYPEEDPVQKAIHFRLTERFRKWYFEGEDRNRFFVTQMSPFSAFSFLTLVMRVPDRLKALNGLYREFLRCLDPEMLTITDGTVGIAPGSPLFPWRLRLLSAARRIPLRPKTWLKRMSSSGGRASFQLPVRSVPYMPGTPHRVFESRVMAIGPTQTMLENASEREFQNWWTLTLLEELWRGSERTAAPACSL